jgi:arylsulfatase A-like enzyme
VLFNPDQWRGDVVGHLGNPAAATPTLDRLAATDGVSFRWAFCQNPVCTPSRCSFMTGWYPHTRGHRTMRHMLHPEWGEPVLLRILKDSGYTVWWGGKNDLVPGQDGPDAFCDIKYRPSVEDYRRWGRRRLDSGDLDPNWRGYPGAATYYNFYYGKIESDGPICDADWANVLGAVDFIRSYDGEKPFCLYLPLTYPHPVFRVEEPFFSMIDRSKIPERIPAPEGDSYEPLMRQGIRSRMQLEEMTEEDWRELRAVYYGMCARVDHQLGLVLEALADAGSYDETALLFFSDHGEYAGDYGLVEKAQNTFEDCLTRVPLLVKPPGNISAVPGVRDNLVELIDVTATVYALSGIVPDYDHFGRSLLPLLADEDGEHRDAVFCEGGRLFHEEQCTEIANNPTLDRKSLYWPRQYAQVNNGIDHGKAAMCRTGRHKYVRRLFEPDQLFDLQIDPRETNDVAHDPAYAAILHDMERRMLDWYMETCDVVPRAIDERSF